MTPIKRALQAMAWIAVCSEGSWAQPIPSAPPIPRCSWDSSAQSTCKFKDDISGTPTSIVGNQVIVYRRSVNGGHGGSRKYLDDAIKRLTTRYNFTAVVTEDPTVFTTENLSKTKVVIMSNGDGDVIPAGANRNELEEFQTEKGWGLIWIHAACAFITKDWPFGQQSCVQQYFHHNGSGTTRSMFIDSGTASFPNQGRKNPQSEFLLRNLPGWYAKHTLQMADEWHCFQAPARNSPGVNVLFGYDRSSGFAPAGCPLQNDASEAASQSHNMVWTHAMGNGITIQNSWGHDNGMYTDNGYMGDSLLWRFIRYAAKDWCVSGSGEPGCDASVAVRPGKAIPTTIPIQWNSALEIHIPFLGKQDVSLTDLNGRRVVSKSFYGPGKLPISGLRKGLYIMRMNGNGVQRVNRVLVN